MDAEGTSQREPILETAWGRHAELDQNAQSLGKRHIDLRKWVAILGVFATFLAIFMDVFAERFDQRIAAVLTVVLIATPLTASLIAAFTSREVGDGRWLAMRAGAEEIVKEIYLYRTVLTIPSQQGKRSAWLSNRLAVIQRQVYKSSSNKLDTNPYRGNIPVNYYPNDPDSDPGFGDITPEEYLRYRLLNQLHWHERKLVQLRKQKWMLTIAILAMGAMGALLAGIGGRFAIWVALTASITAALTGWEELRNRESTIANYSKVKLELGILRDHWYSLTDEQKTEAAFFRMVFSAENLLWMQNAEYIRSMQEALSAYEDEDAKLVEDIVRQSESMHKDIQAALYAETTQVMVHTTEQVTEVIEEAGDTVEGMVTVATDEAIAYTDSAGNVVDSATAESVVVRTHIEATATREVESWSDSTTKAVDTVASESEAVRTATDRAVTDEAAAWRETATDSIDTAVSQSEAARDLAADEVDAWEDTSAETMAAAAATSAAAREAAAGEADAWQESAEGAIDEAATQSEAMRQTADDAVATAAEQSDAWRESAETAVDASEAESDAWRESVDENVEAIVDESRALREATDRAVKYALDFTLTAENIEEIQETFAEVVYQAKPDIKFPIEIIEDADNEQGNGTPQSTIDNAVNEAVDRILEEGIDVADGAIKNALAQAARDEQE